MIGRALGHLSPTRTCAITSWRARLRTWPPAPVVIRHVQIRPEFLDLLHRHRGLVPVLRDFILRSATASQIFRRSGTCARRPDPAHLRARVAGRRGWCTCRAGSAGCLGGAWLIIPLQPLKLESPSSEYPSSGNRYTGAAALTSGGVRTSCPTASSSSPSPSPRPCSRGTRPLRTRRRRPPRPPISPTGSRCSRSTSGHRGQKANMEIKGIQMIGTFAMPAMGLGGSIDIKMAAPTSASWQSMLRAWARSIRGPTAKWRGPLRCPARPHHARGRGRRGTDRGRRFLRTRQAARGIHHRRERRRLHARRRQGLQAQARRQPGQPLRGALRSRVGPLRSSRSETAESTTFSSETEFNDYRAIQGEVKMPFQTRDPLGQFGQTITFEKIVIDPEFDESDFEALARSEPLTAYAFTCPEKSGHFLLPETRHHCIHTNTRGSRSTTIRRRSHMHNRCTHTRLHTRRVPGSRQRPAPRPSQNSPPRRPSPTPAKLPDGFAILEKHVEAVGGEEEQGVQGLACLGSSASRDEPDGRDHDHQRPRARRSSSSICPDGAGRSGDRRQARLGGPASACRCSRADRPRNSRTGAVLRQHRAPQDLHRGQSRRDRRARGHPVLQGEPHHEPGAATGSDSTRSRPACPQDVRPGRAESDTYTNETAFSDYQKPMASSTPADSEPTTARCSRS